jgi:hypothetical protein
MKPLGSEQNRKHLGMNWDVMFGSMTAVAVVAELVQKPN